MILNPFRKTKTTRLLVLACLLPLLAACGLLAGDESAAPLTTQAGISGLSVSNPLGIPSSSRLLLHDIGSTSGNLCTTPECDRTIQRWKDLKVVDTGTVLLKNTRSTSLTFSLRLGSPDVRLPGGERSLTLKPGGSYTIAVQFAPSGTRSKGTYSSRLELRSGDGLSTLSLAGLYQQRPEGSREVYLAGIVNTAFGYKINLGTNTQGGLSSASPTSRPAGEEVRAPYWRAANASSSVSVTQIAAFHSCCAERVTLQLIPRGSSAPLASMRHGSSYGQTLFPRLDGTTRLTQLAAKTSAIFEVRVAGYSSDPKKGLGRGNLGVRFWPLRDAAGNRVANTYLIAHDNVQKGCGTTSRANCDYNDDLYLIKNVTPSF